MLSVKRVRSVLICLCDQGLFSATNFLITVVFGRALDPTEYGSFSIVFAAFLLLVVVQFGMVLEPMMILGPTHFENRQRPYVLALTGCNAVAGLAVGCGISLVLALSQNLNPGIVKASIAMSAASPFLVTAYTLRRACYILNRTGTALIGSALSFVVTLGAVMLLWKSGALTSSTVFLALFLGASVCIVVLWTRLQLQLHQTSWPTLDLVREVIESHWSYGSWATGCMFLNWLFLAAYFPVLGRFQNLESTAILRAVDNFSLPFPQLLTAFSLLFLPRVAKIVQAADPAAALKMAFGVTAGAAFLCIVYFGSVWLSGPFIARVIYRNRPYANFMWMIPWLGLVTLMKVVTDFGMGLFLRASRRPDLSFAVLRVGAVITVLGGLPACAIWGLNGAVFGRVVAGSGELAFGLWFLLKMLRRRTDGEREFCPLPQRSRPERELDPAQV